MQKKLIALAVAGLVTAPAFAQSNVTIYGRADYGFMGRMGSSGGLEGINGKNEFGSGLESGSRLGFKGAEDLGNGLKAIFEVEYGIAMDQVAGAAQKGTASPGCTAAQIATKTCTQSTVNTYSSSSSATWTNRHSYVGLTGNFGTVVGGRLDGVRYGIFNAFDPFGGGGMGNFTQMTSQVDRADNAVAYISPSFSGLTATLAYSTNIGTSWAGPAALGAVPGEGAGNRGDAKLNTIMLAYDNGPLALRADAEQVYSSQANLGGVDYKVKVYTFAASWDFGMVKVSGLYDINKLDVGGNDVSDVRSWFVGAKAPIGGAIVVKAQYGETKEKDCDACSDDPKSSKWGLGADYNLSKRTNFYADIGYIHNSSAAIIQISPAANTYGPFNQNGAYGTKGYDIGIAHKF